MATLRDTTSTKLTDDAIISPQQPPATVSVTSGGSTGTLLALGVGAVALLMLTDNPVKKTAEDAEKIVGGVANVVVSATDMIALTLTWPQMLADYIRFPKKDKAKLLFEELYPSLIKAAASGALARASVFVGYRPDLAVVTAASSQLTTPFKEHPQIFQAPIRAGNFSDDFGHILTADTIERAKIGPYASPSEWANVSIIAVHATRPIIAYNGWVVALHPDVNFVLDLFRYGQSQDDGFNIWPDGSDDHPREGWVEGFLVAALFRSLVPNVPVGFTQGRVLSTRRVWRDADNKWSAGVSHPSLLGEGWIMKVYWPANLRGFVQDRLHMPVRCSVESNSGQPWLCCVGSIAKDGKLVIPYRCELGRDRNVYLHIGPAVDDLVFNQWPALPLTEVVVQIDGRNEIDMPPIDFTSKLAAISLASGRFGLFPEDTPDWYLDAMEYMELGDQRSAAILLAS